MRGASVEEFSRGPFFRYVTFPVEWGSLMPLKPAPFKFKPGDHARFIDCPPGERSFTSGTILVGTVIEITKVHLAFPDKEIYEFKHPASGDDCIVNGRFLEPATDLIQTMPTRHTCTCPLPGLMANGCTCGGQ